MTPLVESNAMVLALLLLTIGVLAGLVAGAEWFIEWRRRRTQHRMFDRIPRSRWPSTDYRVGSVYRSQDTH
jgi:hypothetical protein